MVFFLLALLALSPAVAAQPCAAEGASFDAAQRAYNQTVPERREDLLQAAQALYGCPGASAARRSDAMAWAVHTLGHARRHEEQLALLDAFFADPSLHTNPRRIVWAHGSRRDALFQLGRPLEVLASLHTVLSEADTLAANVRAGLILELAQTYQALGHREQRRQRIAEALSLLDPERDAYLYSQALERQAWTMATDAIRESPRDVASLHLAETYARRAIDVAARVPEEPQRLYALWNAHSARSEVLHRLGAYEASLQAALQAQDIARRVDPVTLPGQVLKNLGTALVRNGRSSEGLAVFEEMLRIAEEHRPRDVSRAHYMIGWAHAEAGRDRAAERHFRLSVVATERARLETGLSAWGAQAFTQSIGHYNEITALLLRAGRAGEAFEVADASRARMLRDLRRYGRLQERSAEERAAHDALRNDLDATYAAVRAGAPSDAAALMAQASRLEADLAELTGHVPTLQAPPLAEIQQRLAREGRFLVSYFLGRADAGHLPPVAFVVSGSSFHAVSLPVSQDTLSVWVRQALSLLADPRVGRTPPAAPLQRLYDALFHPVAHLVPEGAPLTIVPDGLLHALPFGALLSGPAEPFQYHAWPYLVRRNPLSTVLSAALLVEPSAPPARRPLVAFGRSRFAGASPPPPFSGPPPPPLPHIPAELASLRRHVPGGTFALDEAATPEALRAVLAEAHVLHLASHTYVSAEEPLFSAVLLHGEGSEGALYVHELLGRSLNAALVVLSGCESALGQALPGEGVSGLHSAFQAAGAGATLATLWAVDDAATARLMDRFYRHLARGLSKDRALQQAQLDVLGAGDRLSASPFFWAGLTLSGDPSPVGWERPGPPAWAWLLGGGGLLALALLAGRSRS